MPAYIDALAHYRVLFPTLESLGDDAASWLIEWNKLAGAVDALQATSANLEGGSVAGFRNMDTAIRRRALAARRAELDEDFVNPYTETAEEPLAPRRIGFVVVT